MTNSNSGISKHYHQLTSVQCGQIQAMLDSGITSRTVIAQEVGCHKSTISLDNQSRNQTRKRPAKRQQLFIV